MNAPTIGRRDYRGIKGEKLPGVTDVLGDTLGWNKETLMRWSNRQGLLGHNHETVSAAAALAGTEAHSMVEKHLRGMPTTELGVFASSAEEKAFKAYTKFAAWWPTSGLTQKLVEVQLVDQELGYGGTIDLVAERDTHCIVSDFKSGKRAYDETLLQLAAYAGLLDKHGMSPTGGGMILHFPVEGEPNIYVIPKRLLEIAYGSFVALLGVYKTRHLLKLPKAEA